jgi:hypothetical protein
MAAALLRFVGLSAATFIGLIKFDEYRQVRSFLGVQLCYALRISRKEPICHSAGFL